MRLYELDGSVTSIEEIYETILRDCQPYISEIGGIMSIWKLPYRQVSLSLLPREFYDTPLLSKLDTQPERRSRVSSERNYNIIEKTLTGMGHASRIKHAYFTSSQGKNHYFTADEMTPRVIPIGEFKYSYCPGDFNDVIRKTFLLTGGTVNYLLRAKRLVSSFLDTASIEDIIEFLLTVDDNDLAKADLDDMDLSEAVVHIRQMLRNIQEKVVSSNLPEAFNGEHEIWFNSKSYYAMSSETYKELMVYISNQMEK